LGKELGYLPGEMQEKMRPWMQPIFDNLEFILGNTKEVTENKAGNKFSVHDAIKDLMQMELLQVEPLTYIRGRSIPQQFLIVDEAQNLSPHEVKTIITRAGEGTKIVLTGDPEQIDHPYLNTYSNGLSYTMFHFMDQKIAAHITLKKGERSYLAELASQILD
jgi:PhoH-like ATPase